ncbi:MAG: DUF4199 family protein [Bacteroidales bacterium]|nr:DUF4199 family protein [Bacteroidales bacterium]
MKRFKEVWLNDTLKMGLIAGVVFIVYQLLIYVLDVNIFSVGFSLFSFVFTILVLSIFMVKGIKKTNKNVALPLNFGQKFLLAGLIGFIASIISSLISFLINFVIDFEGYQTKIENFIFTTQDKIMSSGLSDEIIHTQMTMLDKQMERLLDPSSQLLGLLGALIGPAIIGFIVAAVVNTKSDNPIVDEDLLINNN